MKPLVVAATKREARAIGHGAVVVAASSAMSLIEELHQRHRFDALIIAGVCGGLDPSLSPGSIILGRNVRSPDLDDLSPDRRLFAAARRALRACGASLVSSNLLTVGSPAASRDDKTALWNTYGAAGVDMETYPIAAAAQRLAVPWLAIRSVLDPGSAGLPATLRAWRPDASDAMIARTIARRPWEWPAAARLAWQMRIACRALRDALDVVLPGVESLPAGETEIELVNRSGGSMALSVHAP